MSQILSGLRRLQKVAIMIAEPVFMSKFRRRKNIHPTAIGKLVLKALPKSQRQYLDPRILVAWYRAVPLRVAQAACPTRFRDGILTVTTKNTTWSQELAMLRVELERSLRKHGVQVKGFRYRVGKVVPPPPARQKQPLPRRTLPLSEMDAGFAQALATVDDDELRELLRAVARVAKNET